VGSHPAEEDGFLRAITIRSTTSFEGEVKPSAPCHKIYGTLKIPAKYDRDTSSAKFTAIFRQVLPASLPDVCAGYFQRALADESGMITCQMGKHNGSENGRSAWDALCDIIH
jgi:hypothetical protein